MVSAGGGLFEAVRAAPITRCPGVRKRVLQRLRGSSGTSSREVARARNRAGERSSPTPWSPFSARCRVDRARRTSMRPGLLEQVPGWRAQLAYGSCTRSTGQAVVDSLTVVDVGPSQRAHREAWGERELRWSTSAHHTPTRLLGHPHGRFTSRGAGFAEGRTGARRGHAAWYMGLAGRPLSTMPTRRGRASVLSAAERRLACGSPAGRCN